MIGGGKERMASLLTDEFVREHGLPTDPEGQRELLAGWHRKKTAAYKARVAAGEMPARPGFARIVDEALAADWTLAVASTSAEESVRATLEHAVGKEKASHFSVLAGDAVPAKKPDPGIYLLALERTGADPDDTIVIEDSRNGLRAAVGAGPSLRRHRQQLHGRGGLLRGRPRGLEPRRPGRAHGDPREPQPGRARPIHHTGRPAGVPEGPCPSGGHMSDAALSDAEQLVRTIADTALENEKYFSDLDAVVGDGDFGYSLARGFGKLVEDWDSLEYDDVSGLLKKTAMVLSSRIGGTSGPIWGTAFLRAGTTLKDNPSPSSEDVIAALRASIDGIKQRGNADLGDKTLLDALIPATDRLEQELAGGASASDALAAAAVTARESAEATKTMLAKRGRAAYAGERSMDSVDAGAMAIAVLFERVSTAWRPTTV